MTLAVVRWKELWVTARVVILYYVKGAVLIIKVVEACGRGFFQLCAAWSNLTHLTSVQQFTYIFLCVLKIPSLP